MPVAVALPRRPGKTTKPLKRWPMTTSVMVQTKSGETEQVTPENFRAWKKRRGANAGFAVQLPDNNEVVLVNTISGLRKLPVGEVLQAELL